MTEWLTNWIMDIEEKVPPQQLVAWVIYNIQLLESPIPATAAAAT